MRRRNLGQSLAVWGGITYILFGLLLWWGLDYYIQPGNSTEKKDLVQAFGFIMAGVAGAVGIYFTGRNLQQGKEAQVTERFTRAIEQLGSEKLEIKLGGIYALERLAKDSPKQDYPTIMEVLTAYVRENAPRKREEVPPANTQAPEDEIVAGFANQEPPKPSADIQAILTVLGRREKAGEKDDVRLDLSATDLRGAQLIQANLQGVRFADADLRGALLADAKLQSTFLRSASMQGSILVRANLQQAILHEAKLQGANLAGANLEETFLIGANFQDAHDLLQTQIDLSAIGDKETKLPGKLRHPDHWSKRNEALRAKPFP